MNKFYEWIGIIICIVATLALIAFIIGLANEYICRKLEDTVNLADLINCWQKYGLKKPDDKQG